MTTLLPKDRIVDALAEEFAAIDAFLSGLDDADWSKPSPCPGWDVRANVAHIIGTESMLLGIESPSVDVDRASAPHVLNDIGGFNEVWVVALASTPADELLAQYRSLVERRLEALRAMPQRAWDAEGFTPAGRDTYGRFMRIRVFDCWMHEQDMRDAVGRPGHESGLPVDVLLDEMVGAMGFAVGKKAGAPPGSSVTFELTGDAGRTFHVAVGERASVVDSLDGGATVTLRMPVGAFTRIAGGREGAPTDAVEISGDEALGSRIVARLGYTI